jgi:hypothetical protein
MLSLNISTPGQSEETLDYFQMLALEINIRLSFREMWHYLMLACHIPS